MSVHRLSRWSAFAILVSPAIACAVKVEWVPVRATGAYEIRGNEIILEHGGQRVWFEAYISEWGPGRLEGYLLSMSQYLFGVGDPRLPHRAFEKCTASAECAVALDSNSGCGEFCHGGPMDLALCRTGCGSGTCAQRCTPAFVDTEREDFVLRYVAYGAGFFDPHAGTFGLFGSAGDRGPHDDGTAKYVGTLVIDIPHGWAGEFVLEFDHSLLQPVWVGRELELPREFVAARVSVRCTSDVECEDFNVCTSERCRIETGTCEFGRTFDVATQCCDPYTGTLLEIRPDKDGCAFDVCNRHTGEISLRQKESGTFCSHDGRTRCNRPTCEFETGVATVGQRGTPCDDSPTSTCDNPCTCGDDGYCRFNLEPDPTPCDDGIFCNGAEACLDGECVPMGPPRCGNASICDEKTRSCPFRLSPLPSFPPHNGSISTNQARIVLYGLDWDMSGALPPPGDFDLHQLLSDGGVGPDILNPRGGFFTQQRRLEPAISFRARTFVTPGWYALRHVGRWGNFPPFEIHFLVQPGDANGDGRVNTADLAAIQRAIGSWDPEDFFQANLDVNQDFRLDIGDLQFVQSRIPQRAPKKPSGHGP